jgi:tyrosine-protein phosphatase YwqE
MELLMSMKVKDLSPNIQAQIVELETQNILPILASVGLNLTEDNMREQLQFFRESEVVLSLNAGSVDGFAVYEIKGTTVMIVTFNLR